MTELSLSGYADAIALHEEYSATARVLPEDEEQFLINALLAELQPALNQLGIRDIKQYDADTRRQLLDSAITILSPNTLSQEDIIKLDQLLQSELSQRELFDAKKLAESQVLSVAGTAIIIWRGDITTLKVDAIVNAANTQMLGCYLPQHKCIDNVIHSRAGVQLRSDCQTIMQQQGHNEATGLAKITRAYNLPSNYVIHTVGPIVEATVNETHQSLLTSSYTSILNLAAEIETLKSLAFCSISTGVFGYPIEQATPLAIETVKDWLINHPGQFDSIIFNVFSEHDLHVYQSVMNAQS